MFNYLEAQSKPRAAMEDFRGFAGAAAVLPLHGPVEESQATHKCAHPGCSNGVRYNVEMGSFCCKKCHWTFTLGKGPGHGRRCMAVSGAGRPKAQPSRRLDASSQTDVV